ncbi:MAG: ThiF family adenylyltransferase [Rhizobiales bacterium]|nr:ThiF family adenylyltransferase [Hyphomicrobiales bacterium]
MSVSAGGAFSPEEIERYARHIVLSEVGGPGQQRLKAARVLVIGAGGLGAPVIQYLAAAGVGTIGIVDDDAVSLSNLQRQVVHRSEDVAKAKTASAAAAGARLNPHVSTELFPVRLDPANADAILARFDVVADGSDNFETRYLVADRCDALGKPLVTAAVGRFDGSVTTLKPYEARGEVRNPSYQVLKLILGVGDPLIGRLLLVDALSMRFETIRYRRRSGPVDAAPRT